MNDRVERILAYAAEHCRIQIATRTDHPTEFRPFAGQGQSFDPHAAPAQGFPGRAFRVPPEAAAAAVSPVSPAAEIIDDGSQMDDLDDGTQAPRSPMLAYMDTMVGPDPRDEVAEKIFVLLERIRAVAERAQYFANTLRDYHFTSTYGGMIQGFVTEFMQSMNLFQGQMEDAKRRDSTLYQVMKIQEFAVTMEAEITSQWKDVEKKVAAFVLDNDDSAMMAKDMQGEMAQDDECLDELEGGLFIKRRRITSKRHDVLQLLQSGANEGASSSEASTADPFGVAIDVD